MLRQMSFTPFDHQLSDGQHPLAINQTDHQDDTLMTNFAAVSHKHHAGSCQIGQRLMYK